MGGYAKYISRECAGPEFFFGREGLRDNFVFREGGGGAGLHGLFLVILPRELIRYHNAEGRKSRSLCNPSSR